MRLMLWSVPRSRSTAFFRMMAERGDFSVVHEPFSYLVMDGHTGAVPSESATVPDAVAAPYLRRHLPYYEALYARRLLPA